jgi:uncharacterized membrane protein
MMKNKRFFKYFIPRFLFISIFLFFLTFELLTSISCKDTQTNPSSEIVFPDSNVSFSKHVGPLFQQRCARAPCHTGSTPAAGLNLDYPSYTALTSRPGMILAGNANQSVLVQHLDGRLSLMPPPNFQQLTQNQINGVKKWINEGANLN